MVAWRHGLSGAQKSQPVGLAVRPPTAIGPEGATVHAFEIRSGNDTSMWHDLRSPVGGASCWVGGSRAQVRKQRSGRDSGGGSCRFGILRGLVVQMR